MIKTGVRNAGGEPFDWNIDTSGTGGSVIPSPLSGRVVPGETQSVQFTVNTNGYTVKQWHNLGTITITAVSSGADVINSPKVVSLWLYVGDISYVYLPTITR